MKRVQGFTLIEMILTLVLISIVSGLLMVSLKNPLDALSYFKQSFATVEPMIWVDQTLKQAFRGSSKTMIQSHEGGSLLRIEHPNGRVLEFECQNPQQALVQKIRTEGKVFEGTLLTQTDCEFTQALLNQGKQIQLKLSLKASKQDVTFNRLYYVYDS